MTNVGFSILVPLGCNCRTLSPNANSTHSGPGFYYFLLLFAVAVVVGF